MKPIIVGVDFSKGSYVAIDLAINIANKLNKDITLVWVRREKKLMDDEEIETMSNLAESKLKDLCADYQSQLPNNKLTWEVLYGKVGQSISDYAKKRNAPMILIGTNGASGFEKYFMGSTAVRIVQVASVPVLTVRDGFNFKKPLERIVVPIRTTLDSRQKVAPAATMAKAFNAKIELLGLRSSEEDGAKLQAFLKQTGEFFDKEGIPYTTTIQGYTNYAETVITFAEECKADLIVINTEQDRLLAQLFLGTNAQQIVHKSPIPVLSIHPADLIKLEK